MNQTDPITEVDVVLAQKRALLQAERDSLNEIADDVLHDTRAEALAEQIVKLARIVDHLIAYLQDPDAPMIPMPLETPNEYRRI